MGTLTHLTRLLSLMVLREAVVTMKAVAVVTEVGKVVWVNFLDGSHFLNMIKWALVAVAAELGLLGSDEKLRSLGRNLAIGCTLQRLRPRRKLVRRGGLVDTSSGYGVSSHGCLWYVELTFCSPAVARMQAVHSVFETSALSSTEVW